MNIIPTIQSNYEKAPSDYKNLSAAYFNNFFHNCHLASSASELESSVYYTDGKDSSEGGFCRFVHPMDVIDFVYEPKFSKGLDIIKANCTSNSIYDLYYAHNFEGIDFFADDVIGPFFYYLNPILRDRTLRIRKDISHDFESLPHGYYPFNIPYVVSEEKIVGVKLTSDGHYSGRLFKLPDYCIKKDGAYGTIRATFLSKLSFSNSPNIVNLKVTDHIGTILESSECVHIGFEFVPPFWYYSPIRSGNIKKGRLYKYETKIDIPSLDPNGYDTIELAMTNNDSELWYILESLTIDYNTPD